MRIRDEQKELLVREKSIELLVKDGFEGFSMHKLAKAADISPATLYIYYKDKEDLIRQIGMEVGTKMTDVTLDGFSPTMSFETGLRHQWENRSRFWIENRMEAACFEVIRNSPQCEDIGRSVYTRFRPVMEEFIRNAVRNGQLNKMSFEVYWSIAYGPLYNLLRFHQDGKSKAQRPFTFTKEVMNETLELVLKALKP